MDNKVISEVQVLHSLIMDNYKWDKNNVLPRAGEYDKFTYSLNRHKLSRVFDNTKAGRESRLDTLAAILPILQWKNGRYIPIELDSTNRLWVAEIRGLISWLTDVEEDGNYIHNEEAYRVLSIVSGSTQDWAITIRKHLGFIERPIVAPLPEVAYGETKSQGMGEEAPPYIQQELPF